MPITYNPKKHKKLKRDIVISITDNWEGIVGVYWQGTSGKDILFATTPTKADKIIKIFNNE
jgi:hypothetical protein